MNSRRIRSTDSDRHSSRFVPRRGFTMSIANDRYTASPTTRGFQLGVAEAGEVDEQDLEAEDVRRERGPGLLVRQQQVELAQQPGPAPLPVVEDDRQHGREAHRALVVLEPDVLDADRGARQPVGDGPVGPAARFASAQSRRDVVGQTLEYAANGHRYWTADELRDNAVAAAARAGRRGRPQDGGGVPLTLAACCAPALS